MQEIKRNAFYEKEQLDFILKGIVKISTLAKYGLHGSPARAYWGGNVVDAIDRYWEDLSRRGGAAVDEEGETDEKKRTIFDNSSIKKNKNGKVHAPRRSAGEMESQREGFKRLISENKVHSAEP